MTLKKFDIVEDTHCDETDYKYGILLENSTNNIMVQVLWAQTYDEIVEKHRNIIKNNIFVTDIRYSNKYPILLVNKYLIKKIKPVTLKNTVNKIKNGG